MVLLCDHAQEVGGKLYILGGGWSIFRGTPVTMGLAVKIAVPWDGANAPHSFTARLVTEDGTDPLLVQPDATVASSPIQFEGRFEAGRPAGVPPGSDLDAPFAVNIAGLPLQPGRYEWRLAIDGEPIDRVAFTVMAA
jgi:hypothetical protein